MSYDYSHPVSRTYQYRKITKPLLERKRRARINRCLEELKDLMVEALKTEGENISKLEKADILELTVRHLQRLRQTSPNFVFSESPTNEEISAESRWQSGFGHCATEACKFLSTRLPAEVTEKLAKHLAVDLQTSRLTNSVTSNESPSLSTDHPSTTNSTASVSIDPAIDLPSMSESSAETSSDNLQVPSAAEKMRDVGASVSSIENKAQRRNSAEEVVDSRVHRDSRKTSKAISLNEEDEEEIDVERVDDRDPMWRPW